MVRRKFKKKSPPLDFRLILERSVINSRPGYHGALYRKIGDGRPGTAQGI